MSSMQPLPDRPQSAPPMLCEHSAFPIYLQRVLQFFALASNCRGERHAGATPDDHLQLCACLLHACSEAC